jgi:hypothetical protein
MSVALRRLRKSDASWIDTWLEPVAASVGFGASDATSLTADPSRTVAVITRRDRPVGLIAYRLAARETAIIELVATPLAEPRSGAGMRAAALLEASLRRRAVRTIYAPVSEVHGIAMYFWIRLGYRPLLRDDWPRMCDRVVWLRRDIASRDGGAKRTAASRGSR